MSDRRAYAKFIQEADESKKNMQELNPLYISPISVFQLPESFPRDKNDWYVLIKDVLYSAHIVQL